MTSSISIEPYDGLSRINVLGRGSGLDGPIHHAAREQFTRDMESAGPSKTWSLRDFEIGKQLGKGNFGKVYLAKVGSANPYIVCLKCLVKDDVVVHNIQAQVRREIEIMQSLRHPHILRLYGWFHDETRIFLILEFAGQGEIYKHLRQARRFSDKRSARYIRQVADGLAYLHKKDIIHRDIKPENLLLGTDGDIKIGDFGWSVQSPMEEGQRTIAGTLSYVAPEVILGRPYGKAVDIWALGVLTYEFVCGQEPFGNGPASSERAVQSRICRCDLSFPESISPQAKIFIESLIRLAPGDRLPLIDIPRQEWIAVHHLAL